MTRNFIAASALAAAMALAAPAQAKGTEQDRGIDCARAATRLEKMTCADPKMMEYDSRIAGAYARALAEWNGAIAGYVRRDQRTWAAEFRTIEKPDGEIDPPCPIDDAACIRDFMKHRADDLESGAYRHSGVYLAPGGMKLLVYPRLANSYSLRLFDPAHTERHVQLDESDPANSMWDGPTTMVARMGDMNGLPFERGGDCRLRLATEAMAITVTQAGRCGGAKFGGRYARNLDETLADYETDLH